MAGYNDPPKSNLGTNIPLAEVIVPGDPTPRALKGGPSSVDNQGNTLAPALVAGDYLEVTSLTAGALNADLLVSTDVSFYKSVMLHITGTWSGTLTIQGSNDNFVSAANSIQAWSVGNNYNSASFIQNELLHIPVTFRYLRVRMTAYTSGTANGIAEFYTLLATPYYLYAAQAGTWTVQPGNTPNTTAWLVAQAGADVTVLASAARTTTQTSADQINNNGKGIRIIVDVTTAGTGSITMTLNGKDVASGKYPLILAGAAITTISTNEYIVYPTITAVANSIAQRALPHTFQIVITANNANSMTYSVGYSILL